MFGVTGTGLAAVKTWRNEGKRPRYSLDQWDKVCCSTSPVQTPFTNDSRSKVRLTCAMCTNENIQKLTDIAQVMERDRRLTGTLRGQTDGPEAPTGFELSNAWKVGRPMRQLFRLVISVRLHLLQLEKRFT